MLSLNNITYANYLFTKVKVIMTTLFVLKFIRINHYSRMN